MSTAEDQPTEIVRIKLRNLPGGAYDVIDVDILDLPSAKGVVAGFAMGGTRIEQINGGYRIHATKEETWDLLDSRVIEDEEKWRQG